jgi:hypothetical protein
VFVQLAAGAKTLRSFHEATLVPNRLLIIIHQTPMRNFEPKMGTHVVFERLSRHLFVVAEAVSMHDTPRKMDQGQFQLHIMSKSVQ